MTSIEQIFTDYFKDKSIVIYFIRIICVPFLKRHPETSKNPEVFIIYSCNSRRQYPPHKIYTKYMEDIVDAGAKFEIGVAIERLKVVPLFKIKCLVGRRKTAP